MSKRLDVEFKGHGWDEYLYWQTQDKKTLKRINKLIDLTIRTPYMGLGEPKPLQHELTGCWSRRINQSDRIEIIQLRFHY